MIKAELTALSGYSAVLAYPETRTELIDMDGNHLVTSDSDILGVREDGAVKLSCVLSIAS